MELIDRGKGFKETSEKPDHSNKRFNIKKNTRININIDQIQVNLDHFEPRRNHNKIRNDKAINKPNNTDSPISGPTNDVGPVWPLY